MKHTYPIDYYSPTAVRSKIKELEEDLWLYDHTNSTRWDCERQITELESWLEDILSN